MQRTPETIKSVIVADKQSKSFRIALSVLKNTFVTIHTDSFLSSHTYSTLTHISHAYDSLLPHLLHSDSYLSCL